MAVTVNVAAIDLSREAPKEIAETEIVCLPTTPKTPVAIAIAEVEAAEESQTISPEVAPVAA